jgi:RNA polymerase sigma factor (sigma-70 family)
MDLTDALSRYQFGKTRWSLVFDAGKKAGDEADKARSQLLIRYHDAVYRYLCARIGDPHAAGELFSRFAERVLEIHPFLQRADPNKGRFRDYLKTILQRMVVDYHRENQRENRKRREFVSGSDDEPAQQGELPVEDAEFNKVWIEELMNQAWKGLEQIEQSKGQPFHSLLLYKAQNPKVRSDDIAQFFSEKVGRPITAANVRQLIHRGQELLNDLLVEEVARSLARQSDEKVSLEQVEAELINLQLLDKHRRKALERFAERRFNRQMNVG